MRIVGGTARGRRLATPPTGTRPTSDRVREAMFNSLASSMSVAGARVLDLYAGTGAVGLEALSRGAADVLLVERARPALAVLRRNIATVGSPAARVLASAVSAALAGEPDGPYDLVFADPPYATPDTAVADVLTAVVRRGWVAPDGLVVVERSARTVADGTVGAAADWLTPLAEKRYGDTLLWYGRPR